MSLLALIWASSICLQVAASRSGPTTLSSQSSNAAPASRASGLAKRPMGRVTRADSISNQSAVPPVPKAFLGTERRVNSSDGASKGRGVVHFLFMVNNALPHASIWEMFFADAPKEEYRAFVHCQDTNGCKKSGLLKALPNLQIVKTVPSWYCHDLVTAMVGMLK